VSQDFQQTDDGTAAGRLVVVQRNPISGTGRAGRQIRILVSELRRLGFRVRLFASRERMDRFLSCDANRRELRCVVAAGGDGTLGDLFNRHPDLPIATLPAGTENLVARYLKIPRCGRTVAQLVSANCRRQFDTGLAGSQRFLLMVSAGIDADVVRRLHSGRSGNISRSSYIRPILRCLFQYDFPSVRVRSADGVHEHQGSHVIVSNIPEYGFRLKFASEADPGDGLLDVRVFQRSGRLRTLLHAIRLRFTSADGPDVVRFQTKSVELTGDKADVPVQCDGDPGPPLPMTVTIDQRSMTLIVRPSESS
jgi:diacylglycerol kinase family enzyme